MCSASSPSINVRLYLLLACPSLDVSRKPRIISAEHDHPNIQRDRLVSSCTARLCFLCIWCIFSAGYVLACDYRIKTESLFCDNTFHLDLRRAHWFCYLLGIVVFRHLLPSSPSSFITVISLHRRLSLPLSFITVILTGVSRHRRPQSIRRRPSASSSCPLRGV